MENTGQNKTEAISHLFQMEFSKMVAVISKLLGLDYIQIAEDIVSDTFLKATETWRNKGRPPNPTAWLYFVAKQKTIYYLRRNKLFDKKVIPQLIKIQINSVELSDLDFSTENIKDSQLQMMFAICSPAIASEAQISLALRILCGFGIDEISEAFLTKKETINKRLFRAKEKLRVENIKMELPVYFEIDKRLENVLHIIYLLFNEGYYSTTSTTTLRKEFCWEALRLALLLLESPITNRPKTKALIALICFHASRFEARESATSDCVLYDHQNENLWNKDLIEKGTYFLDQSAEGSEITSYHVEAGIAFWHCHKEDTVEKRESILKLYDLLLKINYSPSVALNRTYALYKAKGREAALLEMSKMHFPNNHFYYVLLGELYAGCDKNIARQHFEKAIELARTKNDKIIIQNKINSL